MKTTTDHRVIIFNDKRQTFNLDYAHIIGSYSALARNNIFTQFIIIEERLVRNGQLRKITLTNDIDFHSCGLVSELIAGTDPSIKSYLYGSGDPQRKIIIYEHLLRAFPWTKIFVTEVKDNEAMVEEYYNRLRGFLRFLDECRHYGVHSQHDPPEILKGYDVKLLEFLYDQAYHGVKERFGLDKNMIDHENILGHLVRKNNNGLIPSCRYQLRCIGGRDIETKMMISRAGIIFFLGLWLTKEQSVNWLKQHSGYKGMRPDAKTGMNTKVDGLNKERATIELFCYHNIRLPKPLIEPQKDTVQFFLDMINELHRCPRELYDRLDNDNKLLFMSTFEGLDNFDIKEYKDYNSIVKLVRYKNRFAIHAIRFLDYNKLLGSYDFHINLGKYVFVQKEKNYKEGSQVRFLDQKVLRFGNPQDYDQNFKRKIAPVYQIEHEGAEPEEGVSLIADQSSLTVPYWMYANTHYHYSGNQIAIRKKIADNAKNMAFEKLENYSLPQVPATALLPFDAFPVLVFYSILLKDFNNDKPSLEDIIDDFILSFERLVELIESDAFSTNLIGLSEKLTPYKADIAIYRKEKGKEISSWLRTKGLQHRYGIIPRQLRMYFDIDKVGKGEEELCRMMIQKEIEATQKWIDGIKKAENNLSRIKNVTQRTIEYKKEKYLNSGQTATSLIKDIIKYVPALINKEDGKVRNKPNSLQYDMMQKELAYFSISKPDLIKSFEEFGIIGGPSPHPFVSTGLVKESEHNIGFCKNYLREKLDYLSICQSEKNYSSYYFLRRAFKKRGSEQFISAIKENGFSVGIPKAYFCMRLKQLISRPSNVEKLNGWEYLEDCISDATNNENKLRSSRLVKSLSSFYFNQNPQEFYEYNRTYSAVNELKNRSAKYNKKNYYVSQEEFRDMSVQHRVAMESGSKEKCLWSKGNRQDARIRQLELNDQVLILMARAQLQENDHALFERLKNDFLLQNVRKEGSVNVFTQEFNAEIEIPHKGQSSGFHFYITGDVNLKNAGFFFALRKNRLVISLGIALSSLYGSVTIKMNYQDLMNELKRFESVRIDGIKIIREFEKSIYNQNPAFFDKDNLLNSHNAYLEYLVAEDKLSEDDKKAMNLFRNCIMHNQYKSMKPDWLNVISSYDERGFVSHGSVSILLRSLLEILYGRFVKLS